MGAKPVHLGRTNLGQTPMAERYRDDRVKPKSFRSRENPPDKSSRTSNVGRTRLRYLAPIRTTAGTGLAVAIGFRRVPTPFHQVVAIRHAGPRPSSTHRHP